MSKVSFFLMEKKFLQFIFSVTLQDFWIEIKGVMQLNIIKTNIYIFMISKKLVLAAVASVTAITIIIGANCSESVLKQQVEDLDMTCGFTDDFAQFIKDHNYSSWDFARSDIKCASFGGKVSSAEKINKTPIIFIHGNSDIGFGRGSEDGYANWQTGFRHLALYFGTQGYTKAELYTTTWGPADILKAMQMNHKKDFVMMLRKFVEAVLAYTKASHVHLISHSMGVTLARKIAQGGSAEDHEYGTYEVGPSLKDKVKTFIGIAGGNLGLTNCIGQYQFPACSNVDGFYPGNIPTAGPAKYLAQMNKNPAGQGQKVYAVWSKFDEAVDYECVVWGKVTCRIPGQASEIVKKTVQWGHLQLRDNIGPDIIGWLAE